MEKLTTVPALHCRAYTAVWVALLQLASFWGSCKQPPLGYSQYSSCIFFSKGWCGPVKWQYTVQLTPTAQSMELSHLQNGQQLQGFIV